MAGIICKDTELSKSDLSLRGGHETACWLKSAFLWKNIFSLQAHLACIVCSQRQLSREN